MKLKMDRKYQIRRNFMLAIITEIMYISLFILAFIK